MGRMSVFKLCCLDSIGQIWWTDSFSNSNRSQRVLDHGNQLTEQVLHLGSLGWLGLELGMTTDRLPRHARTPRLVVDGRRPRRPMKKYENLIQWTVPVRQTSYLRSLLVLDGKAK